MSETMEAVNAMPDQIGIWKVGRVGFKFEIQETVEPGRAGALRRYGESLRRRDGTQRHPAEQEGGDAVNELPEV
jgi:hypothetical protein